ncbi:hotdog domain-containing protein [Lebetimonas sp. JH292]|uniref:hotdog domain-containing protein n=1 Tax=Lebetimonas sp. JH292 TaxID=990068 RepID=UPI0004B49E4B|nr:hotdog domain-containing protein [Lebetimonas sp. JH292]
MIEFEVELKTHTKYLPKFGRLIELKKDYAKVILDTSEEMAVDEYGLVHGGFTFSAADFCAMATVNEPYVVLVRSQNEFLGPVKVGESVVFESEVMMKEKRKWEVKVTGKIDEIKVFEGIFGCVVLDKHVLKKNV